MNSCRQSLHRAAATVGVGVNAKAHANLSGNRGTILALTLAKGLDGWDCGVCEPCSRCAMWKGFVSRVHRRVCGASTGLPLALSAVSL